MNVFSGWNSTPQKWYSAGPRSRRPTRPTVRLSFTRPASGWTGVTQLPLCVPVTTNFATCGNPWCYYAFIFSSLFVTCFDLFVLCSFSFTGQVTGIRRRWSTTWDRAPDPWTTSSGTRQIDWCGFLNISSGAVYWDNVFPSRYWRLEFCGVFFHRHFISWLLRYTGCSGRRKMLLSDSQVLHGSYFNRLISC